MNVRPGATPTIDELLAQLKATNERLPPPLHRSFVERGAAAVPGLIAILKDEDLAAADSPAQGWPPIHAVDLLIELRAEAAIQTMLEVARAGDLDDILTTHVVVGLPKLGSVALEPLLTELAATVDPDWRMALCEMLSQLHLRDERIWEALAANFDASPALFSGFLAGYGDPRGLALIETALYGLDEAEAGAWAVHDLRDLLSAYRELAGELPEELAAHLEPLLEQLEPAAAARGVDTKVGRNDPCPCGSGKKYKRCCIS